MEYIETNPDRVDKSDISIRFYSEGCKSYADIPDDIVKRLKHNKGEELEIFPLNDMTRKGVALIIF